MSEGNETTQGDAEDARNSGADADTPCETIALPVDSLERFVNSFERSAKRWEIIAYPAFLMMIVLLAYGFFLIYSLTHDIRLIAQRFDPEMGLHMTALANSMNDMNKSVEDMTLRISAMAAHTDQMTGQMTHLETMTPLYGQMVEMNKKMDHLKQMTEIKKQMVEMNGKISFMTADMGRLRYDMSQMNRSVGRPMSFMNSFMPW